MANLTQKNAKELLDNGFITQKQYDKMFEEGIVSASTRASRPQIHVPNEKKGEFTDKAYEALVEVAKAMEFDHTQPHADGGTATLYIKGSGSPRNSDEDEAASEGAAE